MPERERERERNRVVVASSLITGSASGLNAKFERVEIGVFPEFQLGPISLSSPTSSHSM
jgi:hypothetical protein